MDIVQSESFTNNSEVISAFFTDFYYNVIYSSAREQFNAKGGKSITNIYAYMLTGYLRDIEESCAGNAEVILELIRAMHAYYCKYMGEVSLNDFVRVIVACIIPEDYNGTIERRERDCILRDLAKQTAIAVGKRVMKPDMLCKIIDNRSDKNGVAILREVGVEVLRGFRTSLISKLYSGKLQSSASSQVVAAELYEQVRKILKETLAESIKYQRECDKLKRENAAQCVQIKRLSSVIETMRARAVPVTPPIAQVSPPIAQVSPPIAQVSPSIVQVTPHIAQVSSHIAPITPPTAPVSSVTPTIIPAQVTTAQSAIDTNPQLPVTQSAPVAPSEPEVAPDRMQDEESESDEDSENESRAEDGFDAEHPLSLPQKRTNRRIRKDWSSSK